MKIITIYELLGLIKDGKAPKTIGWYDKFYKDFDKISNKYTNFIYRKLENGDWDLHTLVHVIEDDEILEEEKKIPEKLEDRAKFQYSVIPTWLEKKEIIKAINENFEKHQKAIYELIDYLKSKGE